MLKNPQNFVAWVLVEFKEIKCGKCITVHSEQVLNKVKNWSDEDKEPSS